MPMLQLLGISIRQPKEFQEKNVFSQTQKITQYIGIPEIDSLKIVVNSDYVGTG